ncbi:MAG: radical SAM protein [Desulfurococcaceae archaeon]
MKLSKYNLFFSFNSDYDLVYNTLYGSLLLVDKSTSSLLRSGDLSRLAGDPEVLGVLVREGVVLSDDVSEEERYARHVASRLSNYAAQFFIGLTSRCNLACVYCIQSYRREVEGVDMGEKEWSRLYEYIVKLVEAGTRRVYVAFYGGEPLLNAKVAKAIVRDLRKLEEEYGVEKGISIVTNGTVLSSDVEDVVSEALTIQVTIDGVEEVHDKRRPFKDGRGSFSTILRNTVKLVDEYKKRVGVRVNVDEHNIDEAWKLVDFLAELGLAGRLVGIDFSPVIPDQADLYNPLKTSKNYYEYFTSISRKIVDLVEYAVERGFKIPKVFVRGPCICSSLHGYSVDEQLNLYPCPGYMYDHRYITGRVLSGGVVVQSVERTMLALSNPPCTKNCPYAPICHGGCLYLKRRNLPTCLRVLYGDEGLERLVRAYAISRYREIIEQASSGSLTKAG